MDDRVAAPAPDPSGRLSRRRALAAYAPPALAAVAVAGGITFGHSGAVRVDGDVNVGVGDGGVDGSIDVGVDAGP